MSIVIDQHSTIRFPPRREDGFQNDPILLRRVRLRFFVHENCIFPNSITHHFLNLKNRVRNRTSSYPVHDPRGSWCCIPVLEECFSPRYYS